MATYNNVSASAMLTVTPTARAQMRAPVAQCASLTPCLPQSALLHVISTLSDRDGDPPPPPGPSLYETQYTLYSPELTFLSETKASSSTGTAVIGYDYVWFGAEPLAQIANTSTTGTIAWYFTDHLGTPIRQTDSAGRVLWHAEYEPYGAIYAIHRGESRHQPLRLPGQTAEEGSELYQNVFRYYRPQAGRYTQSDPLDNQIAGVINGYRYALSNPLCWMDPTGLESTHAADKINCAANPIDCARVYKCKKEATDAAKNKFGYEKDDSPQNAYKHCYWNCCMAKIIGPEEAKKFGDAHENNPNNVTCKKDMDLWNNEQGRRVTGSTTCDSHCSSAPLQNGPKGPCNPCTPPTPPMPPVKTPSDW